MKKLLIATTALIASAGIASADVSGSIEVDIAETAAGKWAATETFGIDVGYGNDYIAGIELDTDTAGAVSVDEWHIGANIPVGSVSLGKQGNVWFGAPSASAHNTLADPAIGESVKASVSGVTVAVELDEMGTDLTNVGNIQGTYTMDVSIMIATGAINYDTDTETFVFGARGEATYMDTAVGGAVTYSEAADWAYEVDADVLGLTAYLNGDAADAMQNVGGILTKPLGGGLTVESAVNYNIDAGDISPSLNLGLKF